MDRNDVLDLIPAYALGALDPAERAAVEALLATDAEAHQLLAEYQGVADDLALTTPARPAPAHLQADLKARLAAQRGPAVSVPSARPTLQKRSNPLWLPLIAAAAALVVIVGGIFLIRSTSNPNREHFERLVAMAGSQTFPITEGATGEIVVAPDGRTAMRLTDLPDVPEDRLLQLWLVGADGSVTAGMTFDWRDPATVYYSSIPSVVNYTAVAFSIEEAPRTTPQGPSAAPIIIAPVVLG
jgi:anti-sigma-K factor RskA